MFASSPQMLQASRPKLKPLKCEFFKEKIEYLGHNVSSRSVWPSRDDLKAIVIYPEPTM